MPSFLFNNAYLLLAAAGLCWSGNHIVGRAIAGHVPPFGLATARWFLPTLIIWLLAKEHLRRDWPVLREHWRAILFLSLTGGALFSALQYLGLQHTTALNVSVLNSLVPVLIVAVGALLFQDPLRPVQALGIAISLSGVLVIITRLDRQTVVGLQFSAGDLIILFNMLVWAVYSSCLRLRPPIHWLSFTFVIGLVSIVGTLPLFAWEHLSGFTFQATWLTLLAIGYVSFFPSFVAFASWNRGVELIGANRAGPFLHLVPVYTALLAYLLLGEQLESYHVLGFALILAGVWAAARAR